MVAFNQNYLADFEDTGDFGSDIVEQNAALAEIINPTSTATPVQPAAPSQPLTFADLTKLYNENGATTARQVQEGEEMKTYYDPTDLGEGWMAWEKPGQQIGLEGQGESATPIYDPSTLGGFSRKDGDYVNFYDTTGKLVDRQKWNESALKSAWSDLGPVAMAALTMGGGAGALGNALFGLEGAAAAGAGGALAGAGNAALTGQDILSGALKGGLGSAGAMQLGDTGITLGDVNKAVSFIENPSLAGALNVAAPAIGDVKIGDGAISLNDIAKSLNTAAALSSGNPQQIFNAIVGLDRSANTPLKTSLGPGDAQEFSDNLIPGYFQPGGEGYVASEDTNPAPVQPSIDELLEAIQPKTPDQPVASPSNDEILEQIGYVPEPTLEPYTVAGNGDEMTVRQDPEELDTLLRQLNPYQSDEEAGKSVFAQREDIPEFETVSDRPIKQLSDTIDPMDLLNDQYAVAGNADEMTVRQEPENIDSLLRELNPYLADEQPGERTIPAERESDIKDDEVTPDTLPFDPNDILPELPTVPTTPKAGTPAATQPATPATPSASSGMNLLGLMSLLGGQQQPTQQAPMQDPYAHIKLMEDLFGSNIDLTPAGENTAQRK